MDFDTIVERRINKIKEVLSSKAKEYATESDRFHNFRVAGRIHGCSPERALKGMMIKHEVSVLDLIDLCDTNPDNLTIEIVEEKIGDNINYLILLEGLLKERTGNPTEFKNVKRGVTV